ncbi:MAG: shikimate dehydrogenase family protein [Chitinophagales bacterium]
MQLYGLIGYPLSHSFSKAYFTKKFEALGITSKQYELFPLANINELSILLAQHKNMVGLNVTIPYKEKIFAFLDEVDEAAAKIGAVNTIKISQNGKTKGYNTDVYGFEKSLKAMLQTHHQNALILGTGGAAKAVKYVLEKCDIRYKMVSRKPKANEFAYEDIDANLLQKYTLIVNTTPLGMSPNIKSCPDLPYQYLTKKHFLYDLVYNPAETTFLKYGKQQGAIIKNGLEMLHLQAEKAWQIWNEDEK